MLRRAGTPAAVASVVVSLSLLAALLSLALVGLEFLILPWLHLGAAALAHGVIGLLRISLSLPVIALGGTSGEFSLEVGLAHFFGALAENLFALELRHAHDAPLVRLVHVFALQGIWDVGGTFWHVIVAF